ncbi:hypothetical protein C1866_01310 [Eggerthella lenta]|uniref:hypothetical protein n=1 Tax=Eggerthella lenta TaxID=84112 RepID=UPI000DF777D3|nr:hypothetical protein [Eggerthella lenta]RDB99542.1 hypothetical protein C1866_01310 [Eggerthella lenta]
MGKKSTAAAVELRTAKVAELLIDGWSRARICEYALKMRWGVSDGQVDRYIAAARERIKAGCSKDTEAKCALAETRLEALYGKAVEAGDLRLALNVVKEQRALQGLNEASGVAAPDRNARQFYAVLAAYGEALRANLTPGQLGAVVRDANEYAVIGQSLEPDWEPPEPPADCMAQCVEDIKKLGRTRTREELQEAGIIEEDGLELPS